MVISDRRRPVVVYLNANVDTDHDGELFWLRQLVVRVLERGELIHLLR